MFHIKGVVAGYDVDVDVEFAGVGVGVDDAIEPNDCELNGDDVVSVSADLILLANDGVEDVGLNEHVVSLAVVVVVVVD